jgi:hypothetical protein
MNRENEPTKNTQWVGGKVWKVGLDRAKAKMAKSIALCLKQPLTTEKP